MTAIDNALRAKLTEGTTGLWTLVGANVYKELAPNEAGAHYIVFNVQGGGYTNDNPRDFADVVYQVCGYSRNEGTACLIDAGIEARLHNQALTITGWTHVSTMREGEISLTELVNGAPLYRRGALYRVKADRTG